MYAAKGTQHDKMVKLFGKKYIEELMDQRSPKHKGDPIVYFENLGAASDALSACKYTTHYPTFTAEHVAKAYSLITGFKINEKKLLEAGARIIHVEKAINMKVRLGRKDDTFTERFTKQPLPNGPAKGNVFEVDTAVEDYYKARKWDMKTGNPTRKNFVQMGLKDIADDLQKKGIYKPRRVKKGG
jgi:aldehyde:ferredoxin oxidoreductase